MAAVPEQMTTTNLSTLRAVAQPQAAAAVVTAGFFDAQGFELLQRASKMFASSSLVPEAYRGNVANCAIALNLARRLKADELMVMQNLYIVHGNPGWSAKFLIASVNMCGRFTAMRYEWKGALGADDFGCRAWAREKVTGDRLDGVWVTWAMVKAEGWNQKKGSKWQTPMAEQMFIYRAATFWTRAYAPEISMGLSTVDELHDIVDIAPDGSFTVSTETLREGMRDVEQVVEPTTRRDDPPAGAGEEGEGPTYAQLMDRINQAQTTEALSMLDEDIGAFPNEAMRSELMQACADKVAKLMPKKGAK